MQLEPQQTKQAGRKKQQNKHHKDSIEIDKHRQNLTHRIHQARLYELGS